MITFGWFFSIAGLITSIAGTAYYNYESSRGYGYYKYYDSTGVTMAGTAMAIGYIMLILGIIFLIVGYINRKNNMNTEKKFFNKIMCLKCGNLADMSVPFCTKCGNDLEAQKRGAGTPQAPNSENL